MNTQKDDKNPETTYIKDIETHMNIDDIISDEKSKLKYQSITDTIVRFQKTNRALYAIKQAALSAIDFTIQNYKSNPKYPVVFTHASLEQNTLSFYTVFFGYGANGTQRFNAMKNGKILGYRKLRVQNSITQGHVCVY